MARSTVAPGQVAVLFAGLVAVLVIGFVAVATHVSGRGFECGTAVSPDDWDELIDQAGTLADDATGSPGGDPFAAEARRLLANAEAGKDACDDAIEERRIMLALALLLTAVAVLGGVALFWPRESR